MNKKTVLLGILVLLLTVGLSGCGEMSSVSSEYSEDWDIAESHLKRQFKYPSSVDLGWGPDTYGDLTNGHSFVGSGTAQNAFGAKIGFTYYIAVKNGVVTTCNIDEEG